MVLSGGGAKGAYQVGAERVLRLEGGFVWDRIFGVSAGALNAVMLAQHRYEDLLQIWLTIQESSVHRRYSWPRVLWRLARGALGVYDHTPLWKLINANADAGQARTPVHIGYVDYMRGGFVEARSGDREDLCRAVWASASLPIIWPPVPIGGDYGLDGGVRNVTPLGQAVGHGAEEIVVVLCSPQKLEWANKPRNLIDIARRSLEIAMHESFVSDLRETLRINALVNQAALNGIPLYKEDGSSYRHIPIRLIEPATEIGASLDFAQPMIRRRIKTGENDARAFLLKGLA